MHPAIVRSVLLVVLLTAACCTDRSVTETRTQIASAGSAALQLASEPPLATPWFRLVLTNTNDLQAVEVATGRVLWTLDHRDPGGRQMHWRVLAAHDGASIYVQLVALSGSPTYLGTRRIDAQSGKELAADIKNEIYWYENVVHWTALRSGGELQMAITRASAAGGGSRLRTFDPVTLAMRSDIAQAGPPSSPAP